MSTVQATKFVIPGTDHSPQLVAKSYQPAAFRAFSEAGFDELHLELRSSEPRTIPLTGRRSRRQLSGVSPQRRQHGSSRTCGPWWRPVRGRSSGQGPTSGLTSGSDEQREHSTEACARERRSSRAEVSATVTLHPLADVVGSLTSQLHPSRVWCMILDAMTEEAQVLARVIGKVGEIECFGERKPSIALAFS